MISEYGRYVQHNVTMTMTSPRNFAFKMEMKTGPLPRNTELVYRFEFPDNNYAWSSDNNGLETHQRTFNTATPEIIAANVYPMVYSAYATDASSKTHMSLICNRTIGFGLIKEGVELLIHRRTSYDDGRGVGEALEDSDIAHLGLTWQVQMDPDEAHAKRMLEIYQLNFPVDVFHVKSQHTTLKPLWTPVANELPKNVHLLSLERKSDASMDSVLRFANVFEKNHHARLSSDATLDVKTWLNGTRIGKFEQVTLSGAFPRGVADPSRVRVESLEIVTFEASLLNH
jgi:hypothetical protein